MTEPAVNESAAPPVKAGTLLLVDDEPSVLSALRRLFRMNGFATEQATSGAEGLKLMADRDFDLVISDMRMPEMDGAAFLEQVRQVSPNSVRMLLTGYSDIGSTIAAINRGEIHRYIAKPWDDQDLLMVVTQALHKRELELENARLQQLTTQQNAELHALNTTLEARVAARTAELEQVNQLLEQSYAEVKQTFTKAVEALVGLMELRDGGMAGASRRVANIARRMAARLDMLSSAQEDVHMAALLHNVGKIGLSDAMLAKPVSRYTAEEMQRFMQHPLNAEAALMSMDQLHQVAMMIRQRHERVDGRGFPDGLGAKSICLGARILAAASDFEGLTNGTLAERVYTVDLAKQQIREGIGTHYDETVVKALMEALAEIAAEEQQDTEVEAMELLPGMVLSQDLTSSSGVVLLPAGTRFNGALVNKIKEFTQRTTNRLTVRVLNKSIPAAQAPRH